MPYIYGKHPIFEALKSDSKIDKIYLKFGVRFGFYNELKQIANEKNIKILELSKQKFDEKFGDKNTQGIAALISPIKLYEIHELIEISKSNIKFPILVILEHIQDSNNLGAIIRTSECFGIDGIIITRDNSAPIDEAVVKSSSGALINIKIAQIANISQTLDLLKSNGFWIYGTSDKANMNLDEIKIDTPTVLIMGNEHKGLNRLTLEKCDFIVKIPMKGHISSLNVSVAAGIFIYDITKKRNN